MKVVDNKLYGMPIRGQVSWLFLYWNKEVLKRVGIPEPTPDWTYETFLSNARRLVGQGASDFFPVAHAQSGGYENVVANLRASAETSSRRPPAGARRPRWTPSRRCRPSAGGTTTSRPASSAPAPASTPSSSDRAGRASSGRLAGERGTVANNAKGGFEWTFDVVPKGPTGRRGLPLRGHVLGH